MTMDWEEFLDPYIQAVGELKIKLRGIRKQFRKQNRHSPIEFVTGRVKSVASIEEKIAFRLKIWLKICRISLVSESWSNLSMMWMRFWLCFVIVVI